MKLPFVFLLLCVVLPAVVSADPTWPPPLPPITPASDHPRLYVRPDTRALYAQRWQQAVFKDYTEAARTASMSGWDGTLTSNAGATYDAKLHDQIEACAIRYLCEENVAMGERAVALLRKVLPEVTYPKQQDITRAMGATIHTAALVYDWCYPLLTATDKRLFITHIKRIAGQMEVGYPPLNGNDVVGHIGEAEIFRDQLAAGIAIYDEDPEMYNWAAGRLFSGLLPAREFFYASHWHNQGSSYGRVRHVWELWAGAIFKAMTGRTIFSDHQVRLAETWLYLERPDGHSIPDGDIAFTAPQKNAPYQSDRYLMQMDLLNVYLSDNPVIADALNRHIKTRPSIRSTLPYFLFAKPNLKAASPEALPLTKYFPDPAGQMIARTGWSMKPESEDAIVVMKIAPWNFTNHQHLDAGAFQIWYRGALASESGFYQGSSGGYGSPHFLNFYQRSIAHNTLTIEDPSERFFFKGAPVANDGGQHWPNQGTEPKTLQTLLESHRTGTMLGHGLGPDRQRPLYSHLAGAITSYGPKVESFQRSFVFLNLESARTPGVLLVYDRVRSAQAEFKKTWRLHTPNKPTIQSAGFSLADPRGGSLHANVLLPRPDDQRFAVVGGDQIFLSNGQVYPQEPRVGTRESSDSAGWRVELSPATARAEDHFLVALQLLNQQQSAEPLPISSSKTDRVIAVRLPAWTVVFPLASELLKEALVVPAGTVASERAHLLVTGLAAGDWRVSSRAGTHRVTVAEGEHQLYVAATQGEIQLEPVGAGR